MKNLKIYLDTANIESIKKFQEMSGNLAVGVTTTPDILAEQGFDDNAAAIKAILKVVPEIHIEGIGKTTAEIVENVEEQLSDGLDKKKVVFKIPAGLIGNAAIRILSEKGIRCHAHMVQTFSQGKFAMESGAEIISSLFGKNDDESAGSAINKVAENTINHINGSDVQVEYMATSIRDKTYIDRVIELGFKSITAKPEVFVSAFNDDFTDKIYKQFYYTNHLSKKVSQFMFAASDRPAINQNDLVENCEALFKKISTIAVVNDDNVVVGVFTSTDYFRAGGGAISQKALKDVGAVKDSVKTISLSSTLKDAEPFFDVENKEKVNFLIAIDEEKKYRGILENSTLLV
ncbi:MAG: CBS domain-containing protein [Alphaproteobacteria bacterium]|jgi:transaldolase|nr:CBS domain-containing protein [Alphaproteobacteria bacterium]